MPNMPFSSFIDLSAMFAPSNNYFLEKKKSLGHPESPNKLKYNFP